MNKEQLINAIASQTNESLTQYKKILNSILDVIPSTLKNNQEFNLSGFDI